MTDTPKGKHWLANHDVTTARVAAVLELAEKTEADGFAWSSGLVIWLAQGLLVTLNERDALGERLLREMDDKGVQ